MPGVAVVVGGGGGVVVVVTVVVAVTVAVVVTVDVTGGNVTTEVTGGDDTVLVTVEAGAVTVTTKTLGTMLIDVVVFVIVVGWNRVTVVGVVHPVNITAKIRTIAKTPNLSPFMFLIYFPPDIYSPY